MKNVKNKAVVILLTAVLLMTSVLQSGCDTRETKDIKEIKSVTEQFLDAYATGKSKVMKDLVDGKISYPFSDANVDLAEVVLKFASKAKVEDFKSIEVDRKEGKAKARLKISYIDMFEFSNGRNGSYMAKEDYLKAIDAYKDRSDANLTFNFVFDKVEGRWLIKKASAERYGQLYNTYWTINLSKISAAEAEKAFEGIIDGLARGETDQPYYSYDMDNIMIFDDSYPRDPEVYEAALEFTKAYYSYIEDHGINVDIPDDFPYRALISGFAPAKDEILSYISSDEYMTEMCMAVIRDSYGTTDLSEDEIWNQFYAGIYYDLAKQVPYMTGEEYVVIFYIDPNSSDPKIETSDMVFPIYPDEVLSAFQYSDERFNECYKKAAEALYYAGEISRKEYDEIIRDIENTGNSSNMPASGSQVKYVDWQGTGNYGNQALNTYEYVPDWSDGSLIYGASEVDRQGIFMHYSKEPGWLNTAGYHIGLEGVTVMVTFDRKFTKGTTLVYDWYIDGENYGDSVTFTVQEDSTTDFEFTFPDPDIQGFSTCELRLWEADHSHVIAYVKLTKT